MRRSRLALWSFVLLAVTVLPAAHAASVRIEGSRFEMNVPQCWVTGYKDLDNMLMIYFKDPKSGVTLEGIYLRKNQSASFALADFEKWRIEAENKRYAGKDHRVLQTGLLVIGGEKGNYLLSGWKEGGRPFEKHTAQYLKDGQQYMVVLHGPKAAVHKAIFDEAVKTFALVKP